MFSLFYESLFIICFLFYIPDYYRSREISVKNNRVRFFEIIKVSSSYTEKNGYKSGYNFFPKYLILLR